MSIVTLLYNEILYRPLFNALIFLYNVIPGHDFGAAIIALTLAIRLALYPLNQKAIKSQKALQELQPKIKEIQQKYKNEKEKQGTALMGLYKTHKINPASGCLPFFIQFPILIALFSVFKSGLDPGKLDGLYSFVAHPGVVSNMFLGLINLAEKNYFLAILAGALQFLQTKMMMPKRPASQTPGPDFSSMMNKQMLYFFPILTTFFAASLPAGLAVYWVAMTVFGIAQQYLAMKKSDRQYPGQK